MIRDTRDELEGGGKKDEEQSANNGEERKKKEKLTPSISQQFSYQESSTFHHREPDR